MGGGVSTASFDDVSRIFINVFDRRDFFRVIFRGHCQYEPTLAIRDARQVRVGCLFGCSRGNEASRLRRHRWGERSGRAACGGVLRDKRRDAMSVDVRWGVSDDENVKIPIIVMRCGASW